MLSNSTTYRGAVILKPRNIRWGFSVSSLPQIKSKPIIRLGGSRPIIKSTDAKGVEVYLYIYVTGDCV
jgi:hypothetical protein